MALIVQKFGGTSVGSPERIAQVAEKIAGFRAAGDEVVVVVSAMSGETNRLLALAQQVAHKPSLREMDVMIATGEQVTIALLSMALNAQGVPAVSFTGAQIPIVTDSEHGKARILSIDETAVREQLNAGNVVVVAGFQGVDEQGNITTLGRGGSDTTAVAQPQPYRRMSVRFIPMWMVSTPPIRAWCRGRNAWNVLPLKKCSKWPALAQRFYSCAQLSLLENTMYRYAYCIALKRAQAL